MKRLSIGALPAILLLLGSCGGTVAPASSSPASPSAAAASGAKPAGSASSSAGSAAAAASTGAAGSQIVLTQADDPVTLNPAISALATTVYHSQFVFDGLTRPDKDLRPAPSLAETWEASADGR